MRVKFGVGLTIGSVSPDPAVSCIQGVVFEDAYMEDPLKVQATYIACTQCAH